MKSIFILSLPFARALDFKALIYPGALNATHDQALLDYVAKTLHFTPDHKIRSPYLERTFTIAHKSGYFLPILEYQAQISLHLQQEIRKLVAAPQDKSCNSITTKIVRHPNSYSVQYSCGNETFSKDLKEINLHNHPINVLVNHTCRRPEEQHGQHHLFSCPSAGGEVSSYIVSLVLKNPEYRTDDYDKPEAQVQLKSNGDDLIAPTEITENSNTTTTIHKYMTLADLSKDRQSLATLGLQTVEFISNQFVGYKTNDFSDSYCSNNISKLDCLARIIGDLPLFLPEIAQFQVNGSDIKAALGKLHMRLGPRSNILSVNGKLESMTFSTSLGANYFHFALIHNLIRKILLPIAVFHEYLLTAGVENSEKVLVGSGKPWPFQSFHPRILNQTNFRDLATLPARWDYKSSLNGQDRLLVLNSTSKKTALNAETFIRNLPTFLQLTDDKFPPVDFAVLHAVCVIDPENLNHLRTVLWMIESQMSGIDLEIILTPKTSKGNELATVFHSVPSQDLSSLVSILAQGKPTTIAEIWKKLSLPAKENKNFQNRPSGKKLPGKGEEFLLSLNGRLFQFTDKPTKSLVANFVNQVLNEELRTLAIGIWSTFYHGSQPDLGSMILESFRSQKDIVNFFNAKRPDQAFISFEHQKELRSLAKLSKLDESFEEPKTISPTLEDFFLSWSTRTPWISPLVDWEPKTSWAVKLPATPDKTLLSSHYNSYLGSIKKVHYLRKPISDAFAHTAIIIYASSGSELPEVCEALEQWAKSPGAKSNNVFGLNIGCMSSMSIPPGEYQDILGTATLSLWVDGTVSRLKPDTSLDEIVQNIEGNVEIADSIVTLFEMKCASAYQTGNRILPYCLENFEDFIDYPGVSMIIFPKILQTATQADYLSDVHHIQARELNNLFGLSGLRKVRMSVQSEENTIFHFRLVCDPLSRWAQAFLPVMEYIRSELGALIQIVLNPAIAYKDIPVKQLSRTSYSLDKPVAFDRLIPNEVFTTVFDTQSNWGVVSLEQNVDLDNVRESDLTTPAIYAIRGYIVEGFVLSSDDADATADSMAIYLANQLDNNTIVSSAIPMKGTGYFQLKAPKPGNYRLTVDETSQIHGVTEEGYLPIQVGPDLELIRLSVTRQKKTDKLSWIPKWPKKRSSRINVFSLASGHMYERLLRIMMLSVLKHTKSPVTFWILENFLSGKFDLVVKRMMEHYPQMEVKYVSYKWPSFLRAQNDKQRKIWAYKILLLDVLFPLDVDRIIYIDADQIVRSDIKELWDMSLEGAPYAFTPFCKDRNETSQFRFWDSGYWENHLRGKPYHISALFVVDLKKFRQDHVGTELRALYNHLSQDPGSLANLDQDLPNFAQHVVPIFSLPPEWLWCETWCSDATKSRAKTIDLCNNPLTHEHKLQQARRIVPEWESYNNELEDVLDDRKFASTNNKSPSDEL